MTMGYGSGLPQDGTGLARVPVAGGGGGRAVPLETMPAPSISWVTVTCLPTGSAVLALGGSAAWAAKAKKVPASSKAARRSPVRW